MTEKEFFDFINVAENLKNNTRHSVTSKGRPESVAEHSWRVSLMALLLEDEILDADFNKIIRMCILHDLGEAITGDIPSFLKTEADSAHEDKMVFRLMDTLPQPQRDKFVALFHEMLALKTKEAKIYKALDKLEAVIQHNEAPLSSWLPLEYELNQTYGREEAEKADPILKDLRLAAVEHTKRKIETERA
ncbi:HD domain-containing protein [Anaerotignum sp. MB30-C6]|uniref:HD domain-containing protein n=1 Tax=Anaerotignum sp. MB30-C6 TaxID=3070814 RepID=UPI0027DE74A1|nr:HD domain-containing protein [Anaerotignum sp. MB30-C6]WMI81367.1 HD domain-containing protein [Anaerotignum sp. MB30-C6]